MYTRSARVLFWMPSRASAACGDTNARSRAAALVPYSTAACEIHADVTAASCSSSRCAGDAVTHPGTSSVSHRIPALHSRCAIGGAAGGVGLGARCPPLCTGCTVGAKHLVGWVLAEAAGIATVAAKNLHPVRFRKRLGSVEACETQTESAPCEVSRSLILQHHSAATLIVRCRTQQRHDCS